MEVRPQVDGGRHAVKAVPGEELTVRARVFGEGRDVVRAAVILTGPDGQDRPPVRMTHVGNDHWVAVVRTDAVGLWTFRIESWHDPIAGWVRDAQIRIAADIDVELTLARAPRCSAEAPTPIRPARWSRTTWSPRTLPPWRDSPPPWRSSLRSIAAPCATTSMPPSGSRSPWIASAPSPALGTRCSRGPKARCGDRTARRRRARSAPPRSAWRRWRRWASTSSASHRSIPSAPPIARSRQRAGRRPR
ncbi:maltotransferase domain-containing protein [Aeromicrobium sp.]|uniref:maltotransferase domain-containing protein n=1 Tax=Aeromicrobium sp. TaxID=1871063 RepID=UPI003D6B3DA3